MTKITKRIVDATSPTPGRDIFVWDKELRGFGLSVLPTGAKSYVLQYRTGGRGSQARRRVIGRHGELTLGVSGRALTPAERLALHQRLSRAETLSH